MPRDCGHLRTLSALVTLYEECEGRGMLGGERKKMIDEKMRRRG